MPTVLERYQTGLRNGTVRPDPVQADIIVSLNTLQTEIDSYLNQRWFQKLPWRNPVPPKGCYLWGSVGRGKTWMMDLFYDSLATGRKQRIHFHRFMARVHDELRKAGSEENPLQKIAQGWARNCRVLCFDEFHVSDIADAMLLAGLLEALFEQGVILVATSNIHPDQLYHDGLQRARFLPAIELIKKHTKVLQVGGDTDYRLRLLKRSPIYYEPLNDEAKAGLEQAFERMAAGCELPTLIIVNQREFSAERRAPGLVWFTFEELCVKARATVDYIDLARAFNTVFLSELPVMDDEHSDSSRRFINLVDEFYDRNVKLLVSAEAPISDLYQGERLAFEFARTRSRLTEMQSHRYLARPHLP